MENSAPVYAVVGATGAVGKETIEVLEERGTALSELKLLASARSAGDSLTYKNKSIVVQELKEDSFQGVDIALFCAGSGVSQKFASSAVESGAIVVDKTSAFRMDEGVPLAVPEVNSETVKDAVSARGEGRGLIISNPNCSTIPLTVALKPLSDEYGLERVIVSTYQSTSGAGREGMDELFNQTRGLFAQDEVAPKVFQHQIAFNCIPHIDSFLDDGYTKEEKKLMDETRKILSLPDLPITCTAVRVPVFSCHAESVNIQFSKAFQVDDVRDLLAKSEGIKILDDPANNSYPHGIQAAGTDETFVGRIRRDESAENCLNLWIVADNLRKGAALNGVQVAEIVASQL